MGEPAIPPPADRKATHELARAIVEAVRNDEPYPDEVYAEFSPEKSGTELIFRLAQEIELTRAERDAFAKTHELACKLQDADQCEDHATGDDCEQGEIEHQFFEHLAAVRTDENPGGRTDSVARGEKKRGAARPSEHNHVTNDVDDCVSWCPACRENRARGLNPDGTTKQ